MNPCSLSVVLTQRLISLCPSLLVVFPVRTRFHTQRRAPIQRVVRIQNTAKVFYSYGQSTLQRNGHSEEIVLHQHEVLAVVSQRKVTQTIHPQDKSLCPPLTFTSTSLLQEKYKVYAS